MDLVKIPLMRKKEYDSLINSKYISRIAFNGKHPYIAPFLYVFDGDYLYFLSTKYGKKIEMIKENPLVAVEIEDYNSDLSKFRFVTLQGKIEEEKDIDKQKAVKKMFAELIETQNLSHNILAALGHSPEDPLSKLVEMEYSYVWKLVDVEKIIGIKNTMK